MLLSWDKLIETAEPYPEVKAYLMALKKASGETNIEIEDQEYTPVDVRDMIHQSMEIVFGDDPNDDDVRRKLKKIIYYLFKGLISPDKK